MWEKIKSGFSWTWKQIKKHPYLALAATLALAAGAYFVLPIIGFSALAVGITVAVCTIGGQVLGGLLGLFGRKIGLIASSPGSSSTSLTDPSVVNIPPTDSSLIDQPLAAPSLDAEAQSRGTIISTAGTSSNLELRESNSSISLNPVSLFKNTPGSIPTLKDMILNHLGIDALIAESKDKELLFEIAKPTLISHLLQLVAFGKQAEAEELLKIHPSLVLFYGDVTDNAGRTFKDITAFQYALWAKDRHMWQMIRQYLPKIEAAKQLFAHEAEDEATKPDYVKKHGKYFSFEELKAALSRYIKYSYTYHPGRSLAEILDEADTIWTKEVGLDGGAQSRVPVHVVNEYCRDDYRSFTNPRESFRSDLNLPRLVDFYNWVTGTFCSWFRDPTAGAAVSCSVGVYRGDQVMAAHGMLSRSPCGPRALEGTVLDLAALTALDEVRTEEINVLKAELIPVSTANIIRSQNVKKSFMV